MCHTDLTWLVQVLFFLSVSLMIIEMNIQVRFTQKQNYMSILLLRVSYKINRPFLMMQLRHCHSFDSNVYYKPGKRWTLYIWFNFCKTNRNEMKKIWIECPAVCCTNRIYSKNFALHSTFMRIHYKWFNEWIVSAFKSFRLLSYILWLIQHNSWRYMILWRNGCTVTHLANIELIKTFVYLAFFTATKWRYACTGK